MNFRSELLNRYEECLPIKSIEELKNWQPSYLQKSTTVPLQKRSPVDSPKTLVCHDMKGGYLEDRFLHGLESEEIYYFIHWSMVDIFVYFSHHLVTIPPCGWISAGHRNGVKVLGTFITEWDAGIKMCDSILSDVDTIHHFCMQLVSIANFFQFDGWLINIENKLNINQIPLLEEFVDFLTQKMHESQKDSLVIWYDSVIQSGELKWQNELNEHNRNFFLKCDGIFLNYNWTKDTLKKSVDEAGTRRIDVFVGVDVFGRGCLGGGGFSTDIAVTAARDFNLSVAIFAPGWVYECCDSKDFKENQYKFWNALTELCAPRVIEGLPYYTSFCPGFGKEMFRNGKVVCSEQWFNLSLQQPQPSFHYTNCSIGGDGINNNTIIIINNTNAFNGGGCLQLTSKTSDSSKSIKVGLLSTNFLINSSCCISYAFKPFSKNTEVALVLSVYNNKKFYDINFGGNFDGNGHSQHICICSNCEAYKGRSIQPISVKTIKGSDEEGTPWIKRKFKVNSHENENCFVKKVSLLVICEEVPSTEISVLLGELSISPCDGISFTFKDLSVVPKNESSLTVECLLEWTQDNSIHSSDLYVIINGKKKYVWTTSQFWYNFKSCVCNVPEIEFILIPNYSGKSLQPKSLKVPLNCDEKAFPVAGHT